MVEANSPESPISQDPAVVYGPETPEERKQRMDDTYGKDFRLGFVQNEDPVAHVPRGMQPIIDNRKSNEGRPPLDKIPDNVPDPRLMRNIDKGQRGRRPNRRTSSNKR